MNQNLSKSHYMQSSFYAELQPIKNLRIKSQFGYIMGASSYRSYLPRFDYLSASLNNAEDKVTQSMSMYNRWSWDNTANYILPSSMRHPNLRFVARYVEKWFHCEVLLRQEECLSEVSPVFRHPYPDCRDSFGCLKHLIDTHPNLVNGNESLQFLIYLIGDEANADMCSILRSVK